MTARKLLEFDVGYATYRIVRIHACFTALEKRDGNDWLGVERWKCAQQKDNDKWQVNSTGQEWVRGEYVRLLLNSLGDELNRLKLTKKRKPAKKRKARAGGGS